MSLLQETKAMHIANRCVQTYVVNTFSGSIEYHCLYTPHYQHLKSASRSGLYLCHPFASWPVNATTCTPDLWLWNKRSTFLTPAVASRSYCFWYCFHPGWTTHESPQRAKVHLQCIVFKLLPQILCSRWVHVMGQGSKKKSRKLTLFPVQMSFFFGTADQHLMPL